MPLVFALGCGRSILHGCWVMGRALLTMVGPGSSAGIAGPDSCRVTQLAAEHGARGKGSLRAQIWLLWVKAKQCSPSAAEEWHDGQGRATGCPSEAGMWFPVLTCNCCPAPNEPGKTSGFGRWAQHQVKLLDVPLQGEVGAECGAALVHADVVLQHFPWVFPASPMAPSGPSLAVCQAWHAGAPSSLVHSGHASPPVPARAAHAVSSASCKH